MPGVDELLAKMAEAARANQKAAFDGYERELLAQYEGGFDGMPQEVYQRYLDVDRHWPIAVERPETSSLGRTVQIRLPVEDQQWLEELATRTDRSLSAVVAHCLEAVRTDAGLAVRVTQALESGRNPAD